MNTQEREALRMALEALEVATTLLAKDRQEVLRAQAAIREVLAQPAAQWIGLDELDWDDILEQAGTFGSVIRLTEAKLREKNAQPAALAINWEPLQEFWRNNSQHVDWDELEAAVNAMLAAAPEQKGGAKVCETEWSTFPEQRHGYDLASAIRARGQE